MCQTDGGVALLRIATCDLLASGPGRLLRLGLTAEVERVVEVVRDEAGAMVSEGQLGWPLLISTHSPQRNQHTPQSVAQPR